MAHVRILFTLRQNSTDSLGTGCSKKNPGARTDRLLSENTRTVAVATLNFGKEYTAHGFRASASTFMHKDLSIARDVIELCLGHRFVGEVAKAYLRDADDSYMNVERAAAMQRYADYFD